MTSIDLGTISPSDFEDYLSEHGWTKAKKQRCVAGLVEWNLGTAFVLVPLYPHYGDYVRRLKEALQVVATVEGRPSPEEQVGYDILTKVNEYSVAEVPFGLLKEVKHDQ